jgi:RNA polymerase sigma-70 factor (ECF subfamily)
LNLFARQPAFLRERLFQRHNGKETTMDFSARLLEAQNQLRPFFLRLTRDPTLADDINQVASLQCWRYCPDKTCEEMKRLMVTVGRRFYINHRAKERNQKSRLPDLAKLQANGQHTDLEERLALVRRCIASLPDNWREVVERVVDQGQSNEEVAISMGKPLATIKNWRRRALAKLRQIVARLSAI